MFKTNNQRIDQALNAIKSVCGPDEANEIQTGLNDHPQRQQFANALSLDTGPRGPFKYHAESYSRNSVRGLLLTGLVQGKINIQDVDDIKRRLLALPTIAVEGQMKHAFPFKPFSGQFAERAQWDPANFTTPSAGLAQTYRFIVHGIMADLSQVASFGFGSDMTKEQWKAILQKFRQDLQTKEKHNIGGMKRTNLLVNFAKQYLQNPQIIKQNIISASIIDQVHHATYYPFGFILRVPPQCIYSTSPKDLGVTSRTKDVVEELRRVHILGGGKISSPNKVLNRTKRINGFTGYNEIVIVGTSPEGKQVDVNGLFVKCHPNGNYYVRPGENDPYVTSELAKLIKDCSATKGLPIVKIIDSSSGESDFPMDF